MSAIAKHRRCRPSSALQHSLQCGASLPASGCCSLSAACTSSAAAQRCRKRAVSGAELAASGAYLLLRLMRCSVTCDRDPAPASSRGDAQNRNRKRFHAERVRYTHVRGSCRDAELKERLSGMDGALERTRMHEGAAGCPAHAGGGPVQQASVHKGALLRGSAAWHRPAQRAAAGCSAPKACSALQASMGVGRRPQPVVLGC